MLKPKKMLKTILFIIIFLILGKVYFKWFERRNIYFPSERIEYTPEQIFLKYEDISFKTKDNCLLNGWFVPAGKKAGQTVPGLENPTLIFCHGNAGNIGDRIEFLRIFYNLGLNVFIFDYRGYGQSQGCPSEEGTYLDTCAAYDYICSRPDIDKGKIIVYGESLGAAMAIDLAVHKDINLKAVIIYGGFSSTKDMARAIYPFLPLWRLVSIKYDSLSKIKDVTIPKLILHGTYDEIVPFNQGEKLFQAAVEPKEFVSLEGTHNDAILVQENKFSEKIQEFLKRYNIL